MGAAQEDHRRVVGDGALAADDEHGPRRGQRPELGDEYVLAPPAVPREGLLTHHEGHGVRPVAEGPHLDAGKVVLQMPGGSHVGAVLRAADAELRARSVAVAEVAADAHRHLAAQFAGEDDRLDHGLHVVVRGHSRPVPLVVHDDDARLARPHAEEPCLPVQGPRVPPPLPQPDERRAEHAALWKTLDIRGVPGSWRGRPRMSASIPGCFAFRGRRCRGRGENPLTGRRRRLLVSWRPCERTRRWYP